MVQSNSDLASFAGPGETACNMERTGATEEGFVQMHQPSHPPFRPVTRNFVWRSSRATRGRSSSSSDVTRADANDEMAVDVALFRHSFDPWGQHGKKGPREEKCLGCERISRTRATAAAAIEAATTTTVVTQSPASPDQGPSPASELQCSHLNPPYIFSHQPQARGW